MNDNIIVKYIWRKEPMMNQNTALNELTNTIKEKNHFNYNYSPSEVDNLALELLSCLGYNSKDIATPIVKVGKALNFQIFKENLESNLSGDIYINGDTRDVYGYNRVILVNKNDALYHQRFVIAHELAHYFFDFLGNPKYEDTSEKFSDTYYKDNHDTLQEKRANRFAASILMPEESFIYQYNQAKLADYNRMFVITYLSRFFETTVDSIEKRIMEVAI